MGEAMKLRFVAESCGFELMLLPLLTGDSWEWVVTMKGKMAGSPVRQISNPHWLAYAYWKLKGCDQRSVTQDLYDAVKRRWVAVYKSKDKSVDPDWLDRLDINAPFDWESSPPDINRSDETDGEPAWWAGGGAA
jgi:hypothetical protein